MLPEPVAEISAPAESAPLLLTDKEQRLELFESTGIDAAVVLPFDEQQAEESPLAFIERVLVGCLGVEVVVVGDPSAEDTQAMLAAIHGVYAPNKVVILKPLVDAGALEALVPYTRDQGALGGAATAYVCENYACQAPTTDPGVVRASLSARQEEE